MIETTTGVHPSAQIDPSAQIAGDVVIEAEVIVGPDCVIGEGTRLRHRSIIVERTTLGARNDVHPYAVIGGDPQDRAFDPDRRGELIIGDGNIFREHVTISRGTYNAAPTRIGSNCMLMAGAHVGHNAQVGNHVVMANSSQLAGHSRVGDRCVISALLGVHQFTWIGEGVMIRSGAGVGMHVPPFLVIGHVNRAVGYNRVGLARNPDVTPEDAQEIKELYRRFYRVRGGRSLQQTWAEQDQQTWGWAGRKFVDFIGDVIKAKAPFDRGLVAGS